MVIRDVIKKSNSRKNKTKLKRIAEVKRYYLSLYRCALVKLYDRCYISDPCRFDRKEIINNIIDLGISDIFNYTGRVELTSNHVLFAMYKNKNSPEKYEFLKVLYDVLKYKEYSLTVDRVYEEYGFREYESAVIRVFMYEEGAMVKQRTGIEFNEAVARCISNFDTQTKYISINNEVWGLIMKELNIPEEDWYIDGLFDASLSHEEEIACMEGILNGKFKVSGGKYYNILYDWLMAHIWNYNVTYKIDSLGLYDYIFRSKVFEVETILNDKLSCFSDDSNVLAIDKDKIYYNVKRESYEMPYGIFAVVCDKDADEYLLPDGNILNGYTGEAYTLDRLIEDNIVYAGCPIYLNKTKGKSILLYDLEQTNIESKSWFSDNEKAEIIFEDDGRINNFPKGSLVYDMYNGYIDSLKSSDSLVCNIRVSDSDSFESAKKELFKFLGD